MKKFAAILLILGGLVLAVPQIYFWLDSLTAIPIIQAGIGGLAIIFGIALLFSSNEH
ncbi:hypothetical protein KKC94_04585 [Patescibacteria group bacterium]|nr:hypothetical protein [Patescibacteria group bacterium]